jgi:hypothetical protein
MNLGVDFSPGNGYQITKCDNTIWDVMPTNRRVYLDNIEVEHSQVKDPKVYNAVSYKEDNVEYLKHERSRAKVRMDLYKMVTDGNYKVFIGVCTAENARRADFYDYVMALERPSGSVYSSVHGQAIARNRNIIAKSAVDNDYSHVLFIDDDVIFQSHSLYQLLHHDEDIICGLQLKREYPHPPLVFDKEVEGGMLRHLNLKHGQTGLVPIVASGMGFCLIKTDVFRSIDFPYFTMGQVVPDSIGEDVYFYRQTKDKFNAYCDLDCVVGHVSSIVVKPYQMSPNGGWAIDYHSNGTDPVRIIHPQAY